MKFLTRVTALIDGITYFFYRIACLLTLLLVLLTAEQVIERNFFKGGSVALQELEWHLFGLVFLLSSAYCLKQDTHVRVDLIYSKLSTRGRAVVDLLGTIFLIIPAFSLVAWYGFDYAKQALMLPSMHPTDYITAAWFGTDTLSYTIVSPIENFLRTWIVLGEVSEMPGGLEARWLIKMAIPLGFALVVLQSLSQIGKHCWVVISGKEFNTRGA